MAELRPIIVFHGRHFVRHLGICNLICVKLLQVMSGVIPSNLKKNDVSISNRFPEVHKRGTHTCARARAHTDTHTRDDSLRRNRMHCISPKNHRSWAMLVYCELVFQPVAAVVATGWKPDC